MKNKIFINNKDKPKNNNQKEYNIEKNDNVGVVKEISNDNNSIQEKLNNLLNENGYLFNKKVEIVTENKIYHTSIANILEKQIITMDKDVINIDDIRDIKRVI